MTTPLLPFPIALPTFGALPDVLLSVIPVPSSGRCICTSGALACAAMAISPGRPGVAQRLACVECEAIARGDVAGWRAYLTVEGEVAVYCVECAEREFGEDEADSPFPCG